ncbi:MAG: hypothetical protein UU40_C0009G0027 [Candidatus Uhrbacteria bacterium GW2011_GWD2_41_121]|uniref:Uncharacterized protein n=1 Tax=Candidatus Uhrbacteria bacterium GW2011_GWC1_41_20 TaxID=1618983 RepID=A0A0G0VDR9_9BACT|nr:MAG: hypothetical protein UT52_C0012G0027 [Candidatus Uhrbacteria bacterium GW2011_GWE1_39_46]KKR63853.1 MAG: hypothetical protein UU04_C0010G0010 [Candidatus Uhrbacteria bacterium GW2011_GWC2_40_450]KKR90075.1 MAG: hypothetical protein UU40_C0009G0027 [Candidatus Uhrbacteria bacterium GW2011_GWD2_41_121]KKR96035.1 MAG: hypothetical protein UU46_C0009G0024 [Candidatus Uhrbacteria bacterium GW2011_GWD1_41_16]KKR99048.1 MAG: hypothetical protein UU50_C0011G0027 [Candidatus Uhrbacteria bacteriu
MSAVSAIRTAVLPRMAENLATMRESADAIISQISFALEQCKPSLIERLVRQHAIKLHICSELFAKDLRRIEIWCQADFTMDVIIAQSRLEHHQPKIISYELWYSFLVIIQTDLMCVGNISGSFISAVCINDAIKDRASDISADCGTHIEMNRATDLRFDVEKLAIQLEIMVELFDALHDTAYVH